jgi:hypothetical protein
LAKIAATGGKCGSVAMSQFSNRPQNAVTLKSNVTATVKPGADLAPAPASPVWTDSDAGSVHVRGTEVGLDSEPAKKFIKDCARNIEKLKSDRELQEHWSLDEEEWARLAENTPLLNAIKVEREQRIQSGEAAREAAQKYFVRAPAILDQIMENDTISPRNRVEAIKELRAVASGARENTATGERFIISIDLGEDRRLVKEFNLPVRVPDGDGEAQ